MSVTWKDVAEGRDIMREMAPGLREAQDEAFERGETDARKVWLDYAQTDRAREAGFWAVEVVPGDESEAPGVPLNGFCHGKLAAGRRSITVSREQYEEFGPGLLAGRARPGVMSVGACLPPGHSDCGADTHA